MQRLRFIAFAVLLAGIVGATTVYERGLRAADLMDDPEMLGFDRQETRQMGLLYGRQGALVLELGHALKQPRTQAILILVAAALVAGVCWHVAGLLDNDNRAAGGTRYAR